MRASAWFGSRREALLLVGIVGAALALLAVLLVRMIGETGGTNSYAVVAHSFLTGTPWVDACFDTDCAVRDGRNYVVFPPLPGVVAMPLVALFGTGTAGFIAIGFVATLIGLWLWSRILDRLGLDSAVAVWLLVALAFASPLYYVTLRGEGVWFFAQALAFPLVALALHSALTGRLVLAGAALGAAFLCRQMSIFYAPLLLVLTFAPDEPLLRIDGRRIAAVFRIGLPVAVAILCYFAYNYWRFGNPLDTGYQNIEFHGGMLKPRVDQYGIWNKAYVVFNAFYLLLQGFHAEFAEPERIRLIGLDNAGSSILAASPWLLFLFFTPLRRVTAICILMIVGFSAALLFYHSNGFSQYNTQRYTLDWLPAALIMLAMALKREHLPVMKLLIAWGMVLNVATVGILALTHSG